MSAARLRMVVVGRNGQVARALAERAEALRVDVVTFGRPQIDLERPDTLAAVIRAASPDVVVNAAAFTAVDRAQHEAARAHRINAAGAGAVAAAAAALGAPVIQISTDYVFAGALARPLREDDDTGPLNVYGCSKLAGERAVACAYANHAILRTAWVYGSSGANFVTTMLRLAESRPALRVVDDRHGAPTSARDLAGGIVTVARNLVGRPRDTGLRGVFHITGAGETTWAGLAEHVFSVSRARGGPSARVERIPTSAYPTPARRPADTRLVCERIARAHGVTLPSWRTSVETCVARLLDERPAAPAHPLSEDITT